VRHTGTHMKPMGAVGVGTGALGVDGKADCSATSVHEFVELPVHINGAFRAAGVVGETGGSSVADNTAPKA
jgi:hypothetical protein